MEERTKDAGAPPPANSSAGTATSTPTKPPEAATVAAEAPPSRRRGNKRKANNNNSGSSATSQSASSKRQAREKLPAIPFPPIHNGPCTRARQSPNNPAGGGGAVAASVTAFSSEAVKREGDLAIPPGFRGVEALKAEDEVSIVARENLEALETKIEAEYEAIRSRDANAHIVPVHCGWFSWTKIHPLEERALPSFFNGKSESRTSEMYMEIRNWIMKKFHANPNVQIELKDLSELSIGELDARQEVIEFLDYWGLINFHPFFDTASPVDNAEDSEAAQTTALLGKLYQFEMEQSSSPAVPSPNVATPAVPSRLLPESAIAEELARAEEPSVEYHCNSCSADCSRKRYHCQKQADFDLCSECFSNGKFGSDMSPSDFILMEPPEVPGVSGSKWTDQETLLLLEALELYKENWNEIAEHVATKTKAQCILHFVQMPIEDTFLDCDDEIDPNPNANANANAKESLDPLSSNNDSSTPKDALPETIEMKTDASESQPSSSPMETSKPEDAEEPKVDQEAKENCALKALRDAFQAVGSLPTSGEQLSFSEAGNPVMALASFLVRLVEPNVATASVHNSLKSISGKSSGLQMAARHCFLLEDPPVGITERALADAQENENKSDETQKEEKEKDSVLDGIEEEKEPQVLPNGECTDKPRTTKEGDSVSTRDEVGSGVLTESDHPDSVKDQAPPSSTEEPDHLLSKVKESVETAVKDSSQCAEAPMDVDTMPDSLPSEKKEPENNTTPNSVVDSGANTGEEEAKGCKNDVNGGASETKTDLNMDKIKRAAVSAISAAAVKAKLLANQEEDQIRQLASMLIEKQLNKVETKLAFFNEMEGVVMRVREQMERSRQRLYHERAQIIASRLGLPASSSSRPPMQQQQLPTNRVATNFTNSVPRPPMSMMTAQRPPISRPVMSSFPPPAQSSFVSATTVAGNNSASVRPPNQDKLSSVGTK